MMMWNGKIPCEKYAQDFTLVYLCTTAFQQTSVNLNIQFTFSGFIYRHILNDELRYHILV